MEDIPSSLCWHHRCASFHNCIVYNFNSESCGWIRAFRVFSHDVKQITSFMSVWWK